MPPVVLFDKSFLEGLSEDESVWFDHHFVPNICPVFWVETLSDLHGNKPGVDPETRIRRIASCFPEMRGYPNCHHLELCINELAGHRIALDGSIALPRKAPIRVGGKTGVKFNELPEVKALHRWQRREFTELERDFAKGWRAELSLLKDHDDEAFLRGIGLTQTKVKTDEEAKQVAEGFVKDERLSRVAENVILRLFEAEKEAVSEVLTRWKRSASESLISSAPFLAHVVTVELFTRLAINSTRISASDPGERVDATYLFYLPFCHAFASGDRVHRRCAKLFLRPYQTFVWGWDLKAALGSLNGRYLKDADRINARGVVELPRNPPSDLGGPIAAIWDVAQPDWRSGQREFGSHPEMDPLHKAMFPKGTPLGRPVQTAKALDAGDVDSCIMEHQFRVRKGSWVQGREERMRPVSARKRPNRTANGVKIGRNDPCPCGSGNKFKRCHGK